MATTSMTTTNGNGCPVDAALIKALQDQPASGTEYFYSKRLFTSIAGPPIVFAPGEAEVFHGQIGDIDQGYAAGLTYAETNMTQKGKLGRRSLLRKIGVRLQLDGLAQDPAAIAALLDGNYFGLKRRGSLFTYLGTVEDFLMGPSAVRALSIEQGAPPPAAAVEHQRIWSSSKCGLQDLSTPAILEADQIFSIWINFPNALPALAAGETWSMYVKIGVQWLE
jgi:hypothetical protein